MFDLNPLESTESKPKSKRGGSRPGAGRKKSAITLRTLAIADKVSKSGCTPLDVMLNAADEWRAMAERDSARIAEIEKTFADQPMLSQSDVGLRKELADLRMSRMDALTRSASIAKDAAPYLHPKLSSVEQKAPDDPNKAPTHGVLMVPVVQSVEQWGDK